MHEASIAQSMLEVIEQNLGGKQELLKVSVTIGPLSGVNAESLDFVFADIAQTMGFGSPSLEINEVSMLAKCSGCGCEYETEDVMDMCPECGVIDRALDGGYELSVDSVEVK